VLADVGLQDSIDNAMLKLLGFLPERFQANADLMRQRLYFDPSGWYGYLVPHEMLEQVKQAVWNDETVVTFGM
jgi:hypothetical protein